MVGGLRNHSQPVLTFEIFYIFSQSAMVLRCQCNTMIDKFYCIIGGKDFRVAACEDE